MELTFDYAANTYNTDNALALAFCSKWAYFNESEIKRKVKDSFEMTDFKFISCADTDTQGFMCADDHKILIAFRGTETNRLRDFIIDASFHKIYGSLGKVHSGFSESLNSVWLDVMDTIQSFQTKKQSIWFTGHSLGAALATLGTAKMVEFGIAVGGLYTFGQPRVGNQTFVDVLNKRIGTRYFRFVNNMDIVPRTPSRKLGYQHGGTFVYINQKGEIEMGEAIWTNILNTRNVDTDTIFGKNTRDHDMDLYIKGIQTSA